jgi:hypothetical protein
LSCLQQAVALPDNGIRACFSPYGYDGPIHVNGPELQARESIKKNAGDVDDYPFF